MTVIDEERNCLKFVSAYKFYLTGNAAGPRYFLSANSNGNMAINLAFLIASYPIKA